MSQAVEKAVEDFKRQMLAERLSQCSEAQQAFFKRIYPKGVPEASLVSAIDLCDRTIKKNLADPSRLTKQALDQARIDPPSGYTEG